MADVFGKNLIRRSIAGQIADAIVRRTTGGLTDRGETLQVESRRQQAAAHGLAVLRISSFARAQAARGICDANDEWVTETLRPASPPSSSSWASSCLERALTMVVPSPVGTCGASPGTLPTPLSETVSFQSDPST